VVLECSRQAIADSKRALEELKAARTRTEEFPYRFRICIALLMAVGPTIGAETSNGPKDWWIPLLDPDRTRLMSLRTAVLKQTQKRLDPNFQPDDPSTSMRRINRSGQIRVSGPPEVMGVGVRTYSPAWQIVGDEFSGQDPIQVITAYLDILETAVMPQAVRYV
jgi:hypothetical protein